MLLNFLSLSVQSFFGLKSIAKDSILGRRTFADKPFSSWRKPNLNEEVQLNLEFLFKNWEKKLDSESLLSSLSLEIKIGFRSIQRDPPIRDWGCFGGGLWSRKALFNNFTDWNLIFVKSIYSISLFMSFRRQFFMLLLSISLNLWPKSGPLVYKIGSPFVYVIGPRRTIAHGSFGRTTRARRCPKVPAPKTESAIAFRSGFELRLQLCQLDPNAR